MLRKSLMGLGLVLALASGASAQTVDEILAKNAQARGGMEKLKAAKTMKVVGKMTVGPGMEAPFTLEMKRPKNTRMEMVFQGLTAVQAYDGTSGWAIDPFGGKKDPQPMAPEDLKDAEEQADMDGPLVDYKEKGNQVELMGTEKVEGSDAYKLKVTLKNGETRYVFIDSEAFLEIKGEAKRMVRGTEREIETTFGDYKEVGGIMIPHSIDSSIKGTQQHQKITAERVEVNVPIDDARFKMPEVKKDAPPKD